MAEAEKTAPQFAGATYFLLMLFLIASRMLPLSTVPQNWPYPDVMILLSVAYAARRPGLMPAWMVILTFLLADFLLQRPPGLWTLSALIMTESARQSAEAIRSMRFGREWLTVSAIILGGFVLVRFIQIVLFLPLPPLSAYAFQILVTMGTYPCVIAIAVLTLGLSKRAPGALDYKGRKL